MFLKKTLPLLLTFLIGLIAWSIIWYKAIYIPLTHDEVATYLYYFNFNVWELMMYPDPWPNNHILNSILAKFSLLIFGQEVWAGRLPNVLSFLLYFLAIYKFSLFIFKDKWWWVLCTASFFIFNPYLLDFFSLCRGYGLSISIMFYSLWILVRGFQEKKEKWSWWALVLSMLSAYANFTLLVFWCATIGMLGMYFFNQYSGKQKRQQLYKKLGILVASSLAFLTLIYNPIHKMQSTNQFEYWQSNGFYKDTIISLVDTVRAGVRMIGVSNEYFGLLAVLIFLLAGATLFYQWGRQSWQWLQGQVLFVAWTILTATILVNIAQTVILGTPNLTGRTALFLYPLFIGVAASFFAFLMRGKNYRWMTFMAIILIVLKLWHMERALQPDRVREWWYDANTYQVMKFIEEDKESDSKAVLQTSWYFRRSFQYYTQTGKADHIHLVDLDAGEQNTASPDYFYIFDSELPELTDRYDIIEKYDGGGRLLLKKKPAINEVPL
jgi:hypothetical protein